MAINPAALYGTDLAGVRDSDAMFSGVTGLGSVIQDEIHRLTTDNVLGPGGDGWGYNCARLLGMPASKLPALQPVLSEVLTRDPRVLTADVTLTATKSNGLADVLIKVDGTTAQGPFSFIVPVSQLTAALIEGQGT